jgi:hypothetical protein
MERRRRSTAFLGSLAVSLGLYVAVVLASPGLHHDFDCHLKSPRHCQACAANPLAPRADSACAAGTLALIDVGRTPSTTAVRPPLAVVPRLSGRAPPR